MTASTPRYVVLILGFSVIQAIGATQAAPEKTPNDKVIHPLMKGVAEPRLIPGSRINPVYPEQWLKQHLGGVVILQGIVEKSGSVRELTPLKTDLRVEEGCARESVDSKDKLSVPPKAARDFEIAALKAVKQWRYRPAEMNDLPVEVFYTMIVEFTSCPVEPGKQLP